MIRGDCFLQDSGPTEEPGMEQILCKIDAELVEIARRETMSVFSRRRISWFVFFHFRRDRSRNAKPMPYGIQDPLPDVATWPQTKKNTAPLALIYGIVMFRRFHELSRIQRLNTVLLADGNVSKEVSITTHKVILLSWKYFWKHARERNLSWLINALREPTSIPVSLIFQRQWEQKLYKNLQFWVSVKTISVLNRFNIWN